MTRNLAPLVVLLALSAAAQPSPELDYEAMARRAVDSLGLRPGERVLVRFDPGYFLEMVDPLRRMIREAGAIDVAALEYSTTLASAQETDARDRRSRAFAKLLDAADVYIWLPVRFQLRETMPAERGALAAWLDRGGARRQVHFHWSQGSVLEDGLAGEHTAALDRLYVEALDVDYEAIARAQERALVALRSGRVRVRTPAGTDLSFRVGGRPFNLQDGDASPERMEGARIRIDREIELPGGVLRVAPLEETVRGRLVIPLMRVGGKTARNVRFVIEEGRITKASADEGLAAVEAELDAGGEAARRFREFCLGFNPKLHRPEGSDVVPYFGYGAGVVRMSLGDNQELGGAVGGGYRRWFFFPETTVEVGGTILVRDGELQGRFAPASLDGGRSTR